MTVENRPVKGRWASPGVQLLLLLAIIAVSFRLYSSRYYTLLNSDDGLNVLMTAFYRLPHDLYCWGQDRGGTLIPLIGQIFHRGLGISPIWSVSLSNYLLLVLGYIGFARLFKDRAVQLLFALVWFLPPWRFMDMLRFPYGVQYCLVGIALLLASGLRLDRDGPFTWRDHLRMLGLMITAIAAVWASDLAALSIAAAAVAWVLVRRRARKPLFPRREVVLWCVGGLLSGVAFILYAKANATVTDHYQEINSPKQIATAAMDFGNTWVELLLFHKREPYMSVYTILAIITCVLVVRAWRKRPVEDARAGIMLFLAIDIVFLVCAVLSSKWAVLNMLNRRYFIGAYIGLCLLVLLLHELTRPSDGRALRAMRVLLFTTAVVGALSGPLQLAFYWPRTLVSRVDVAAEFLSLGDRIGLIGEYNNAYAASIPDPGRVISTPHDHGDVRNPELVPMVFDGRDIYVIADMWLDQFPDTMSQFGHVLVARGEPITVGGCLVKRYVEVPRPGGNVNP